MSNDKTAPDALIWAAHDGQCRDKAVA